MGVKYCLAIDGVCSF